ncbi:MAG: transcriptional regulator NrdR [Brachymonas sp.]
MKCPFCANLETQVVETREGEEGNFIRRRRQCGACDKRFTTYERPEMSFPTVVKSDGRRVEYERQKIAQGLRIALNKRNISVDLQDNAINHIEEKLLSAAAKEVSSRKIGELLMQELKKLDKIGYIRFASVYREFEDASEFRALVDEVGENQRQK